MAAKHPQAIRGPAMQIVEVDLRTISEAQARSIGELMMEIWPKPGRTVDTYAQSFLAQGAAYRGPDAQHPRSYFVRENGHIIAHASANPRTISTSQGELTILALARVCTLPAVRGRKLGDLVVRAAFQLVDDGTFPFALFQTTEPVKPFYERFGAVQIHNPFVNSLAEDPRAYPFWDKVIMRYPGGPSWPEGEIDLNGPGW
jgi:predicted GNAT family N-acyltransferase